MAYRCQHSRKSNFATEPFFMGEDTTMTIRELRAALATMEANSDVQVVLFKNDGTSEAFELEEVLSNDGHAQLEIYEPEDQA
jgi:hypothetical protein